MKLAVLKTPRFLLGLLLFGLLTIIAVVQLPVGKELKVLAILIASILYGLSQLYKADHLTKDEAKNQTQMRLRCVDVVKILQPDQNLRSNVFLWDKKKKVYHIWQYYNMDTDPAKNVTEIPKGRGCTGNAWESKQQTFGDKEDIFGDGKYHLPSDQESKISHDLEWICSTPILNEKRNVIAVLNFDGNKPMYDSQKEFIKQHAERVASELNHVLNRI